MCHRQAVPRQLPCQADGNVTHTAAQSLAGSRLPAGERRPTRKRGRSPGRETASAVHSRGHLKQVAVSTGGHKRRFHATQDRHRNHLATASNGLTAAWAQREPEAPSHPELEQSLRLEKWRVSEQAFAGRRRWTPQREERTAGFPGCRPSSTAGEHRGQQAPPSPGRWGHGGSPSFLPSPLPTKAAVRPAATASCRDRGKCSHLAQDAARP